MPAEGVINKFRNLRGDVSWERTDGSPVDDLDSPIYYSSASRIFMGPVSGGGGAGSFSLGLSTGGNTAGQTGVTGTRIVLAGGGEITLSQATGPAGASITVSAPPQSAQTQNRFNLTLAGNTAGALQEVSSGTLTLAGGPNITVSQNGNAITISGVGSGTAAQTDQTLGLFALGNTTGQSSSTTRDARSVSLRGDGAVSVGFSAGSIRISAPVQSVQPETQTFVAGVAASDATYTSGTVQLSGLGNVTVRSTTGQQIQISVPAQSIQPETQTFLGGISASDTLYTSGTVRFTGVGGGVTVSTNTGQRVDISVAAPVAQTGTQFSAGVSGGNTSGASGTVAARFVLAGGNRITLSGSTNGASMSVTVSGADAQTGISSIAASDATYTSGQVQFTGSGIITIRSSAGQRVVVDASQSAQTQNRFNLTISGNTAGVGAEVSSGTLTLAGGNNITISQNGNAITISGANVGGAQTGISGIIASDATYSSGTVEFVGSNQVTVRSGAGQQVVIDMSQSVQSVGAYAVNNTTGQSSSTTRDARSLSFAGDGIVSVGFSAGSLRISASQSVQPETQTFIGGISASDTLYTSGTVRLTGVGGGITVSTNTGQRIDLSVAAQSAESQSIGMSNLGNTSGTTGIASGAQVRMLFAGGNNITLSQSLNGASGTLTISAASQTNQSVGMYAVGNTTGQSSSTTRDARSISVDGAGVISVGYSGGSLRISATQSAQSLGMYAVQNTTGQSSSTTMDARTLSVAGDGAVSVGYSAGSLRISAPVQTGTQFSGGISGGNTAGDTGTVAGRVVLAGGNNITLSGSTNGASETITIVGPNTLPSFSGGISGGNTSGQTGATGTRLVFAGGNNITLSGATDANGGTVTISGPNVGGAQTGISGIIASDATYTSGTVEFTGSNMITVKSSGGQRVVIDATQSVQSVGLYALGNTTGQSSSTTRDARSISVEGAGIISVGYSGGSLRISATQSVQPETQTFLGGISVSDTLYTSGTVRFTGVGGGVTVSSNTGQRVDISVAAPVAQTDQTIGLYAVQNTTGQSSSTTRDARSLSFAGDGAASVGFSAGSIRISVPTQTVESQSFGMSNIGNTSGTTGIASGGQVRFLLAGGNNVTLSQSLNGASGTITISAAAQTDQTLGLYAVGNTTGQSSSTTRDARSISVDGAGAVSVGYSAGTLRISAPVQTGTQFSAGISGGNTAGDTGTVAGRVVLAGGANITLSGSTNGASETISIVGGAGGAFSGGFSTAGNTAGDTGFVTGRLALVGSNGITLSGSTNGGSQTITISGITQSVESQSIGMSNLGNTSGTTGIASGPQVRMLFAGGNNITLSQSLNGASGTITISAPNTVAQSVQSLGMYAVQNTTGQSSSTTMDARTLSVAGDGAVSVGYSAGSLRISAPVQTVESQSIGMSNVGNTSGTTGVASGAQVRFVLAGGNNITLSQSLNGASGTITISAPNLGAGAMSAGVSTMGNTAGATGVSGTQMVLVGSGVMSLSQATGANGNTVSILAPPVSAISAVAPLSTSTNGSTISILGPAQLSVGFSTGGNTSGDTGLATGRVVFVGTNNITLSGSTNAGSMTISISGGSGGGAGFSAGVSTGGNTAGATGVSGTRMVLVGTNAISLSQTTGAAGNTVSIDAPATSSLVGASGISISTNGSTISVYQPNRTQFYPFNDIPIVTGQQGQATLHIAPLHFPNIQHDRLLMGLQISNATNSSNSITISAWAGLYSRNASSISLISSISTSTNFSGSGTVGSYSLYGGPKWLSIPWTNTVTEDDYWFGIIIRTTTGGGAGHTVSQLCVSKFTNSAWSGIVGAGSNATDQYQLGLGVYTVSTAGIPASIAFTQINGSGSMALREPIFQLRSGTV